MKFIQYSLSGEVVEQYSLNSFNELKSYPIGEKTKVTMDDGKAYIGFWSEPFSPAAKLIKLVRYNLDENTGKLRNNGLDNDRIMFVPVVGIEQIEAILHSSPRWGTLPTNKFEFSKRAKMGPKSDYFNNWPRK